MARKTRNKRRKRVGAGVGLQRHSLRKANITTSSGLFPTPKVNNSDVGPIKQIALSIAKKNTTTEEFNTLSQEIKKLQIEDFNRILKNINRTQYEKMYDLVNASVSTDDTGYLNDLFRNFSLQPLTPTINPTSSSRQVNTETSSTNLIVYGGPIGFFLVIAVVWYYIKEGQRRVHNDTGDRPYRSARRRSALAPAQAQSPTIQHTRVNNVEDEDRTIYKM